MLEREISIVELVNFGSVEGENRDRLWILGVV